MKWLLGICCILVSTQAFSASENSTATQKHAVFVGVGPADRGDPNKSDNNPWSLGYLYFPEDSKFYWGIDVAGEGTSLNNTSGKTNEVEQGHSLNLLVGRSFSFGGNRRAGVGIIFGGRITGKECPDSYLGFECYADTDPENEYDVNYGAMLHLIVKRTLLGVRVTGESSQMMLGFTF